MNSVNHSMICSAVALLERLVQSNSIDYAMNRVRNKSRRFQIHVVAGWNDHLCAIAR